MYVGADGRQQSLVNTVESGRFMWVHLVDDVGHLFFIELALFVGLELEVNRVRQDFVKCSNNVQVLIESLVQVQENKSKVNKAFNYIVVQIMVTELDDSWSVLLFEDDRDDSTFFVFQFINPALLVLEIVPKLDEPVLRIVVVFESIRVSEQLVCWFSRFHDLLDEALRVVPLNVFFFRKHLDLFGLLLAPLLLNKILDSSLLESEFGNVIDSIVVISSSFHIPKPRWID